ncbi:MAG: GHKL domain-containing protein, partial [Xanthomonadaceae bacterium]|nr:GHKL domain-containing protein [Xanthomonadaceae bacterium]
MENADFGMKKGWLAKIPLWQGNVIFFLILFSLVVSYFFFQIRQAQNLFVTDARNHARLVAGVVRLHVQGAVISETIINGVVSHFLVNSAEFVQYLDSVEPFTADELEAFAAENGFRGITLVRRDGQTVSVPEGWLAGVPAWDRMPANKLQYFSGHHLVFFRAPGSGLVKEIVLGIDAKDLENFHQNVGLPKVLSEVEKLGGILYARPGKLSPASGMDKQGNSVDGVPDTDKVIFKNTAQGMAAEVSLAFGQTFLVVGLDAEPLRLNKRRLWRDFFIFSSILAFLGGLLSYLLYRQQSSYISEKQEYNRQLARQKEDAALGRSAAAIAHEIRNPLNAMAIALQRLALEADELSADHRQLIDVLLDSIKRTDAIIEGLLHYASLPQSISREPVAFSLLVRNVSVLYQSRFAEADISLSTELEEGIMVSGDKNLLAQVLENVLRNASEAQPHGGQITVKLKKTGSTALLVVTNPGDIPELKEMDRIFSPYVTLKTRGTGLGLAITKKIIKAHGGTVRAAVTAENCFELT